MPERIAGRRFLVIGRAGMDLYADPPGTPIEAAGRFTASLGGSSANIAAALARQGMAVAMLACVSDDAVGRFVLAELDRYGIDRGLVRAAGGEARNALAVVDTMGAATQAVLYRKGAADLALTEADAARPDYAAFDALVVTGTGLAAEPARGAVQAALGRARAAGCRVVLDIDHRPYSWASEAEARAVCGQAAARADIVVGNEEEFALLAGAAGAGLDAARDLAAGGRLVVYKRGAAGAVTLDGGRETATGTYRTEALKPTGAGDAFLGGFLAALASGAEVPAAVLRGSATAAMVVARVGCAPAMPDGAELDAFIAGHPGPSDPE